MLPYLLGSGIDIGCGDDPITSQALRWDIPQGDAQTLTGLVGPFDFVFSSHCLEHLVDPFSAVARWWELVKPYGYLIIIVPDEDLYEQGYWPSCFNGDHKWTFTPSKDNSWSPKCIRMSDLLVGLHNHRLVSLSINDTGYDYDAAPQDQTGVSHACAHIEMIVQRLPQHEGPAEQPGSVTFGGYLNAQA